jgi:hypothetical protein
LLRSLERIVDDWDDQGNTAQIFASEAADVIGELVQDFRFYDDEDYKR